MQETLQNRDHEQQDCRHACSTLVERDAGDEHADGEKSPPHRVTEILTERRREEVERQRGAGREVVGNLNVHEEEQQEGAARMQRGGYPLEHSWHEVAAGEHRYSGNEVRVEVPVENRGALRRGGLPNSGGWGRGGGGGSEQTPPPPPQTTRAGGAPEAQYNRRPPT